MLITATAVLALLSLSTTAVGAWKESSSLSTIGWLCFAAFVRLMLMLDRPWEEMLLSALILLTVSQLCFRRDRREL